MSTSSWNIDGIQFSILSGEEIKNRAILEITETQLMENDEKKIGGLLDPRMEDSTGKSKPGNFGYIELAIPIFHIGFKDALSSILKSTCFYCSSLICNKDNPVFQKAIKIVDNAKRLKKIKQLCEKEVSCSVCKLSQPLYTINIDSVYINITERKGEQKELSAEKIKNLLDRVSNTDTKLLGFNPNNVKLSSLIISTLLIPPPSIRPSLDIGSGIVSQDDMTYKLLDIIKINKVLKILLNKGIDEYKLKPLIKQLQYNVSTYMDNTKQDIPAIGRSGKTYISFKQKLDGKKGRIRGNLMGKRVNYSARSVIGGDPNISIDEVGVPYSVAMNVTYPEKVCDLNIDRLQKNVQNGSSKYPGAKYVYRIENGKEKKYNLNSRNIPINIKKGDIVRRHLQDGDKLILNRQPTLHRLSMMGHNAKILPYSTFRLNLAITEPYNADFDGDEMNIHFPQTVLSSTEISEIMQIPHNIISPNTSTPLTGLVQDSLLGIRKFTFRDTFLKENTFMNILMDLEDTWDHKIPIPAIIKPKPTWTGKQVVSILLPSIDMEDKSKGFQKFEDEPDFISKNDTFVKILDGNLICGILDKNTIGSKPGSIIHIIFNDIGPNKCTNFINKIQEVSNRFLTLRSASVGINDLVLSPEITQLITNKVNDMLKETEKMTDENEIAGVLNTIKPTSNIIKTHWDKDNNFNHMLTAGSKGGDKNLAQMMGSIGQNTLSGKPIPPSFENRRLPHHDFDDKSPSTRGFIKNCYINGLEPSEFILHMISGREGITDTAVKTASTGYIQRRFIKTMEDMVVKYDGTVRNSMNEVVQFVYGGDSLNTIFIEKANIESINMSKDELLKYITVKQNKNNKLLNIEYKDIINDWKYIKKYNIQNSVMNMNKFYFPYNLNRIILTAKKKIYKNDTLSISSIITKRNKLFEDIEKQFTVPVTSKQMKEEILTEVIRFMKIHLQFELCCKNVLEKYQLSKTQYDYVINYIKKQYRKSIIHPGEVVGITAAQAFGEPTTQMTLNTFHSAGMAGANVTLGVPRLEEIIKFKKKLLGPWNILIPMKKTSVDSVNEIINKLQYVQFKDIIENITINNNDNLNNYLWNFTIKFNDNNFNVKQSENKMKQFLDSNSDVSETQIKSYNSKKAVILINVDKRKNSNEQRKILYKIKSELVNHKISGISGINSIKKYNISTGLPTFALKNIENIVEVDNMIYIDGNNLKELLNLDGIEHKYTLSNNLWEIKTVFGLEAARTAFLNELKTCFVSFGIHITNHHYETIADCLLYKGKFVKADRLGVNKRNTGALTKASFEETFKQFMNAGMYGEYDGLFGVSGNIIVGQTPKFGTGLPYLITK